LEKEEKEKRQGGKTNILLAILGLLNVSLAEKPHAPFLKQEERNYSNSLCAGQEEKKKKKGKARGHCPLEYESGSDLNNLKGGKRESVELIGRGKKR